MHTVYFTWKGHSGTIEYTNDLVKYYKKYPKWPKGYELLNFADVTIDNYLVVFTCIIRQHYPTFKQIVEHDATTYDIPENGFGMQPEKIGADLIALNATTLEEYFLAIIEYTLLSCVIENNQFMKPLLSASIRAIKPELEYV